VPDAHPTPEHFVGPHCEIRAVRDQERTVLSVRGDLDLLSQTLLTDAADAGRPDVVIDLSGAEFLDAAGVRAIVDAADRSRRRGGCLRVVDARPFQRRLLLQLGLGELLGEGPVEPLDATNSSP
jgi:anti-anti-sigma factor